MEEPAEGLSAVQESLSAANSAAWGLALRRSEVDIRAAVNQIRDLVPELSEEEALGQALRLDAGSRLIMVPDVRRPKLRIEED